MTAGISEQTPSVEDREDVDRSKENKVSKQTSRQMISTVNNRLHPAGDFCTFCRLCEKKAPKTRPTHPTVQLQYILRQLRTFLFNQAYNQQHLFIYLFVYQQLLHLFIHISHCLVCLNSYCLSVLCPLFCVHVSILYCCLFM